ncbi:MAG: LL-diaminopimelate aminotransferase [Dehalococcoidales bacterium]|nr:LL-diaminopimelate aminotransferase [Dehalococcoidales bacterium]
MKLAKRVENLPPYLFVEITKKIAEKRAKGEEVISFAIGDPDYPTPSHIIDRLCTEANEPENHHYPESAGMPELRAAIAEWYQKRFNVTLDPDTEVLPLIGAKEGIAHLPMCFVDPGDTVLVPDPGYPVYGIGTLLVGGEPYYMPMDERNRYLPELDKIPADVLKKTKMMWLNYPNNPTGAVADIGYFKKVSDFANEHDIIVAHDAPYTEIAYDGLRPVSYLQAAGSREHGVEFHSFSKTYNMTGWRIGMMVGNAEIINALKTVKSNMDSGIPRSIQLMAIEALKGPQDSTKETVAIYQRRRDLIIEMLNNIGIEADPPKGGLYIWARVPEGYESVEFAEDLLEQVGVVVTPGTGYGKNGEGYVRMSLTIPDAGLVKGLSRLTGWRDQKTRFKAKRT